MIGLLRFHHGDRDKTVARVVFEVKIALEMVKKGGKKWGSVSVRGLVLSVCPLFQKGGWGALLIAISVGCWGSRFFEVGLRFSVPCLEVSARDISDGVQNKLTKVLPGFEIALQIDERGGRKGVCVVVWVRFAKRGVRL